MSAARNRFLEKLIGDYGGALKSFLVTRLRSADDAEDIVQETFLRVCRLDEPEKLRHPRAFLFTTARNLAVDEMRRRRREGLEHRVQVEALAASDHAIAAEDGLDVRRDFEALCDAIVALPPQCRRAFILRRFYNLSYKEIAEEMGITVKTVEKHLAKGLILCREHLRQGRESNVVRLRSQRTNRALPG